MEDDIFYFNILIGHFSISDNQLKEEYPVEYFPMIKWLNRVTKTFQKLFIHTIHGVCMTVSLCSPVDHVAFNHVFSGCSIRTLASFDSDGTVVTPSGMLGSARTLTLVILLQYSGV